MTENNVRAAPLLLDTRVIGQHSRTDRLESLFRDLIDVLGEDTGRNGLVETPRRAALAWEHWVSGYDTDPANVLKTFEYTDGDGIVVVSDIPVYSHCEHHLAPFFGVAHIGYVPNGRIVGLSKMSRLVNVFSRRLQVQERLTQQVAGALMKHLAPRGVGVVLRCRHLCMESRGVQGQNTMTQTNVLEGEFRTDSALRAEFLARIG